MKKTLSRFLIFILALVCTAAFMTGCAQKFNDHEIMQKIYEATTYEKIFEDHESLKVSYNLPGNISFYLYVDSETYLSTDKEHSFAVLHTAEESCEVGFYDNGTQYFDRFINVFNEDLSAALRAEPLLTAMTDNENVTSMKEEGGILYIETSAGTEDIPAEEIEALELEMAKGDYYICEYKVDAASYRMLESYEYIKRADGTTDYQGRVTFSVDAERPTDYINSLIARGDEIDALPEDQTRVINIIVDAGTSAERTVSQKVIRGDMVLLPQDMHGYEMFLDPEGKQLVSESANNVVPDEHSSTYYLIKTE